MPSQDIEADSNRTLTELSCSTYSTCINQPGTEFKPIFDYAASGPSTGGDTWVSPTLHKSSENTYPVNFFFGAQVPYIDLCGDEKDTPFNAVDQSKFKSREVTFPEFRTQWDMSHRIQNAYDPNQSLLDMKQCRGSLISGADVDDGDLDALLPDTQQDSYESFLPQESDVNTQQLGENLLSTDLASSVLHSSELICQSSETSLPDTRAFYLTPPPSLQPHCSTSDIESPPDILTIPKVSPKLSCRERKRLIVHIDRPTKVTKAMKSWVYKTFDLLDPFREDDDCWFHPTPPPARLTPRGNLRPYGNIQKAFTCPDRRGSHNVILNFGIVYKLLFNTMTKQQKDGFINKGYHLSHLCGNWTCLNPDHTTVESGSINISRNACFSHRSGCGHNPPCMKDKKVFLDADGKQVDPCLPTPDTGGEASQASGGSMEWSYWNHDPEDGEDFIVADDPDEVESISEDLAMIVPA